MTMFSSRYQRGSRSLADNLTTPSNQQSASSVGKMGSTADDDDDDEEYDIPDEIEDVIGNPNVANYN